MSDPGSCFRCLLRSFSGEEATIRREPPQANPSLLSWSVPRARGRWRKFVKEMKTTAGGPGRVLEKHGNIDKSVADLVLVDFPECQVCYADCFDD